MKMIRALSLLFVLAAPALGGVIGNPSEPEPPPPAAPVPSVVVPVATAVALTVLP